MAWKIEKRGDQLLLYTNLLDVEAWASYFYDFKYALEKKDLNYTELTDLLYEAENHGLLKFGALTGQPEEINHENKKQIQAYYKTLED